MDSPAWLRKLAAAVLLQALRDLRKPAKRAEIKLWLEQSGPLGESVHTIVSTLGIGRERLLGTYARLVEAGDVDADGEDWLRHFVDR